MTSESRGVVYASRRAGPCDLVPPFGLLGKPVPVLLLGTSGPQRGGACGTSEEISSSSQTEFGRELLALDLALQTLITKGLPIVIITDSLPYSAPADPSSKPVNRPHHHRQN